MLFNFVAKRRMRQCIAKLHGKIVAASRQPGFYLDFGVPDTFEGRFEMLVLHTTLVMRRLQQLGANNHAKALADEVFAGLDAAMREMGVGDTVLPKRMGRMLEAFSGRMLAYNRGMEGAGPELAVALGRNALFGLADGTALARYVRQAFGALERLDLSEIEADALVFPAPEHIAAAPTQMDMP